MVAALTGAGAPAGLQQGWCNRGRIGPMYLIRERIFDLGDDFDITDDSGRLVYHVDGKVLSVRDRLVIEDPSGREVASVYRQLVALRRTYAIEIGGDKAAEVRKNLFTPFRDKYTIDIPGPSDFEMRGDLLDHEYAVERDGREVATVSKRWLSIRDTYAVNVVEGEDHLLVLAAVLALDLAQSRAEEEREQREERDRQGG
ncbi:LURP-one-related/scramblase family protein [Rugosimonospora acidiphila]|uniref:LURP-one-related/scramblase family protein n=1 Tax=Rugosimonospora acidiphila TaxID=556531 RepID=A0ABP9SND4_9ACTN